MRYEHRWESATSDDTGVISTITGPDGLLSVSSRWVLACDGASSPVRRMLGIEPEGPHRIQSFVMVHLAADLRDLVGDHPGVLFWICDPVAGGTFVAHDIDREWVYMHAYDPDAEDAASLHPRAMRATGAGRAREAGRGPRDRHDRDVDDDRTGRAAVS